MLLRYVNIYVVYFTIFIHFYIDEKNGDATSLKSLGSDPFEVPDDTDKNVYMNFSFQISTEMLIFSGCGTLQD